MLWLGLGFAWGCDGFGPIDSRTEKDGGAGSDGDGGSDVPSPTTEYCEELETNRMCMYSLTAPYSALPGYPEGQEIIYPHFCRGDSNSVLVYTSVLGSVTSNRFAFFGGRGIGATMRDAADRWLTMQDGLEFSITVSTTGAAETGADTRDGVTDVLGSAVLPEAPYGQASAYCSPRSDNPCHSLECTITVFAENDGGPLRYTTHRTNVAADKLSLEAILVHEFGHVVGLGDTNIFPGYVMGIWPGLGDAPMDPAYDEYIAAKYIYGPR